MDLGHVFGCGHQGRHGTKRIALEVHVESGYYHPDPLVGQIVTDRNDLIVKELCFVYTHHIAILRQGPDMAGRWDRSRSDLPLVMRDHPLIAVTGVYDGLENLYFLFGEFGPFQASDKFFCFARKHGPADHLNPPKLFFMINSVFEKHFVILDEIRDFLR